MEDPSQCFFFMECFKLKAITVGIPKIQQRHFRLNFHRVQKTPTNFSSCIATPKLSFGSQRYAEAAVAIGQHHCLNN